MAHGESQKHLSPGEFFSVEALLDWLAPIVVVIVIGGMILALVGAMLAPAE
jgi:type II secretory pathway component PulF